MPIANRARAGILLFSSDSKELLTIHRIKADRQYWTIPGGGIESDETPEEAAIREIKEELSITLSSSQMQFVTTVVSASEEYYYAAWIEKAEYHIGGEEALRSSENNRYIPEWVAVSVLTEIDLRPAELVPHILTFISSDRRT